MLLLPGKVAFIALCSEHSVKRAEVRLIHVRTKVSKVKEINKFLQLTINFNAFFNAKNK